MDEVPDTWRPFIRDDQQVDRVCRDGDDYANYHEDAPPWRGFTGEVGDLDDGDDQGRHGDWKYDPVSELAAGFHLVCTTSAVIN